jgi:hypothetical protein
LDLLTLSYYAKALFEDRAILDEFYQEVNDDANVSEATLRTTRVCDSVPAHLSQSYFKVRINDKYKFIHKSTACWVLTEQNQKLSPDRTRRVTQTK